MLSLLVGLSAAAQPATTTAPATANRKEIPVTLILSGGVSLGSYEAGLSWAITRLTQVAPGQEADPRSGRLRLVAVTGASAGSVNAVLSALVWCADPAFNTDTSVDDNPLRNTWVSIGLDRLLPDAATQYQEGDGLLSSRPLVEAFDRFRDDLLSGTGRARFTPGCRLPIGITVTRSQAEEQQVAGLTVRTQRFVLPWLLEVTAEGQPRFVSLRLAEVRDVEDDVLTLAGSAEPGGVQALPFDQVAQGLLASTASAGMRGRSRNRGVASAPWSSPLASRPSLARSWQTSAPSSTSPCASSTTTQASTTRRTPLQSSFAAAPSCLE